MRLDIKDTTAIEHEIEQTKRALKSIEDRMDVYGKAANRLIKDYREGKEDLKQLIKMQKEQG
jgi:hypothetical protein